MEIKKIYIDMDGVLADFDEGLRQFFNMEPEPQGHQTDEGQGKMWEEIKEYGHFYFDLPPIEGAIEAFKLIYEKYGDACEILTGIPKEKRGIVHAKEDKVNWVRKYLSEDIKVNLVLRKEKQQFVTGKDCVLIDDYRINATEWTDAGGTAILFETWEDVLEKLDIKN